MSVVIDLSQTDTKAFDADNMIQLSAKENFSKLIKIFLDDIKKYDSNENKKDQCNIDRVHNTILINGKRGMGKTSFILSVQQDKNILANICPLCIIDPTLIETKEHILLNIITLIKNKVDDLVRCNECNYGKDTQYKNWKESLKKLAGGLSMLDGVGSDHLKDNTLWDSPELILERGLSNAKQGADLEKNFHKFIDKSLILLNKDAFFLILDDIDTSLNNGMDVLEILRKYLTTRKLIIAMLGDIDLYSTLVRQLQWEKMDPNGTLEKYEGKEKYIGQIEHLEEQYLTKVLKPENRIDLKNLWTLKENIFINKEMKTFTSFVQEMIEKVYLTSKSDYLKYYEHIILTQPTRSVMQILQAWNYKEELDEDFVFRIKHTFYSTIKKKLESYSLVDIPLNQQFLNLLSIYILTENISRDNHLNLVPEFAHVDDNIVMLYLNAMANHILTPKDYLSYFVKVGYVLERFNATVNSRDKSMLLKFIDGLALDSSISTHELSKKLLKSFTIDTNTHSRNPIFFGNLSISQDNLKSINQKTNLSLLMSQVYNQDMRRYNFLSIFNLFGLLADISYSENIEDILDNLIHSYNENEDKYWSSFDISKDLKVALVTWTKKSEKIIQKLSIADLSNIWIKFVYSMNDIEDKSENRKKSYSELLDLYFTAFLNRVFIHCEQKKGIKDLDLKNPSIDSNHFYNKLIGYKSDESNYTFFDYLYECPLFVKGNTYFSGLEEIKLSGEIINTKSSHDTVTSLLKQQFEDQTLQIKIEAVKEALSRIEKNAAPETKEAALSKNINSPKLITSIINQLRGVQSYRIGSKTGPSHVKKSLIEIWKDEN
ncbi:MAG: hypothetical protein PHI47_08430 [Sulfuricurvum sp.]|uniref:hypothetical protein n=1 Tax=Sulfuricurvum sp. TaxID=2025608 RepID=UPI00262E951B|nr:hypothetical protein [Sulfuricurvum sp.]MDD5160061.1 hypothetical protein [Sulfuricurvum sp.]